MRKKLLRTGQLPIIYPRDLGFSAAREILHDQLYKQGYEHTLQKLQRTLSGRFDDQQLFLRRVFNYRSYPKDPDYLLFKKLFHLFCFYKARNTIYIDIGPALANEEYYKDKNGLIIGTGKPGVSSQEVAINFPFMNVFALDLPVYVQRFMGVYPEGYNVSERDRWEFFCHKNLHVISGNGLSPILNQLTDTANNPIPDRQRPKYKPLIPVIIRICNSVEIYFPYSVVRPQLCQIADDFFTNPLLLFFNKWIYLKPMYSSIYLSVGQTSDMGFNHNNRYLNRGDDPFFTFFDGFREVIINAIN